MPGACIHLNELNVQRAIEIVSRVAGVYCSDELTCVSCYCGGSLNTYAFQKHLLDEEHYICLRTQEPYELYCSHCGDFQYSEEFDRHVGRIRSRNPEATKSPLHIESSVITCKGMCNMGSTCFMGSVLQIFIHNKILCKIFDGLLRPCGRAKEDTALTVKTDHSHLVGSCIACEIADLCAEANSKPLHVRKAKSCPCPSCCIVPSRLLYSVWKYADYLAGYEQQDAHEFLIALLGGIQAHIDSNHSAPAPPIAPQLQESDARVKNAVQHIKDSGILGLPLAPSAPLAVPTLCQTKPKGLVDKVFSGVLRSDLICQYCYKRSSKFEEFFDLSLSISTSGVSTVGSGIDQASGSCEYASNGSKSLKNGLSHAEEGLIAEIKDADTNRSTQVPKHASFVTSPAPLSKKSKKTLDISDCLRNFTALESLSELVVCENCKTHRSFMKQLIISEPPEVLILQLKRFNPLHRVKLNDEVTFPLRGLNLAPFISSSSIDSASQSSSPRQDSLYDLHGLVSHMGSLNQGHYISFIPSVDDTCASDHPGSLWFRCDDDKVCAVTDVEVQNSEGYIFFYSRINSDHT